MSNTKQMLNLQLSCYGGQRSVGQVEVSRFKASNAP